MSEKLSMEQVVVFVFSLLIIVVALITSILTRASKSKSSCISSSSESIPPLPPGPRRLPIIGHLHHLVAGGAQPHRTFRDLSARHGPLMLLRLGQYDFVVVSSREAAEEVLRTHDLCFASRPEITRLRQITYGYREMAMASYGPNWRLLRKICTTELLTAKRVASYACVRKEAVSSLVDDISSIATASLGRKEEVNLRPMLQKMTNDIIAKTAFSQKFRPQLKEEFLRIMKEVLLLATGFSVSDLFPSLEFIDTLLGVKGRMEKYVERVDTILNEMISEHEACLRMKKKTITSNDQVSAEVEDLLDILLLAKDKDWSGPSISLENVKAVALEIFIAGTDTSSSTIHWAMSELMRNPKAMEKVQREVRFAMKGKRQVEEEDLNELNYLKQVIKETLRLHPASPLLVPRLCRETCQVLGYTIREGTRVLINVWALGRDSRYWDQPEIFLPERFDRNLVDFRGSNFEFLPFGAGRRICPGMNFGLANVELPLAQMLHCFDWELPHGMGSEDLDMTEMHGIVAGRKADLILLATPHVSSQVA